MAEITDDQIDFIISDFTKRGVVLEDLRDNLLDHMCCIIENEMPPNDNFYQFYDTVLPRFFRNNLGEIQTETENLIRFKNFYTMKKTMNITGVLTVILILSGAILKTLHLPGAGISIVSGGFLFSLIFLPLLIAIKFKDDNSIKDKIVFSFGLLLGMILSAGFIFKLMHWPYANILMILGTVVFTFCYVPVYFITRIKRPELKFNTIVNSVLMFACGGILFAMFNLKNSKSFDDLSIKNIEIIDNGVDQIINSNLNIYSSSGDTLLLKKYHNFSLLIFKKTDELMNALNIDSNSGSAPNEASSLKQEWMDLIVKYNLLLKDLDMKDSAFIDISFIKDNILLSDQRYLIKMSFLRVKQKVAINENTFLISKLKK